VKSVGVVVIVVCTLYQFVQCCKCDVDCAVTAMMMMLFAADTLADGCTSGETVSMPLSLARCSPSALTGEMVTLLRSRVVDTVACTEPVVNLVASVFSLCSAEVAVVNAGLAVHLSPQVSRSLARVLCRWSGSYLFPDLSCYEQLSRELGVPLLRSPHLDVCWTVTFLLKYITVCMKTRSSELALVDDLLQLFSRLVDTKERYAAEINS